MKAHLERLLRYSAWANQRSIADLRECPAAHAEALPLLAHLLAAEHVWLSRLMQRPAHHAVWPTLNFDGCVALAAENEAGYRDYFERQTEEGLAVALPYRTSQGHELISTASDILTQVGTHGAYHRGQIAKIIGRSGGAAMNTDFITYTREAASGA